MANKKLKKFKKKLFFDFLLNILRERERAMKEKRYSI